ncbi:MAG: tetraacyldisaccharide 4'-kinase [Devosiaceae bacterium]|nr:tetraacyldisaccharide 4'-kinase [Devosiaceae bacterium MH13]
MSWSTPSFWWPDREAPTSVGAHVARSLLYLPSLAYGSTAANRMEASGKQGSIPTVCVGNFVAGGAGKTPVALHLGALFASLGLQPAYISRGYGGSLSQGSHQVDRDAHTSAEVGDEPLLLARQAPTWVGADRLSSIEAAANAGARVALLDDGLQNPAVRKNLSIAVLDGRWGVGNGLCHPAGPLRAPLGRQMDHVDFLVLIGTGPGAEPAVRMAAKRGKVILSASLIVDVPDHVREKPLVAFCGIGRPDKFFDSLKGEGLNLVHGLQYADHHPYSTSDAERLVREAQSCNALLVTTEKDLARLKGARGVLADLAAVATAIPVRLAFDDPSYLQSLVERAIARWRRDLLLVEID